jgi:hypothetical protein
MTGHGDDSRRAAPEREDLQRQMARWGKQPVPVAPSDGAEERRARGLVTLRAAIGSAGRERQTRRMRIASIAAAAAALALWGGFELFAPGTGLELRDRGHHVASQPGLPSPHEGRALVRGSGEVSSSHGGWVPVQPGHTIGEGDRVRALDRSIDVRLDRITSARVAPGAVLAIATLSSHLQELRLESGATEFEVDPKRAAEVVVHTANARIRVTGTVFSVTSGGTSSEAWSEVLVERGRVEVASHGHTFVLQSGQSWSSRDFEAKDPDSQGEARFGRSRSGAAHSGRARDPNARVAQAADATTQRSTRTVATGVVSGEAAETRDSSGDAEGLTTTLSEENRILRGALSARNAGNGGRCVGLLSELLTKFPSSPLRQEAMVAHFRCLQLSGDGERAQRSAARYLSEYPGGFARDEARALLLDKAP